MFALGIAIGFLSQMLSFALRYQPVGLTTIWVPGGAILGVLLARPCAEWPVFVAGSFLGLVGAATILFPPFTWHIPAAIAGVCLVLVVIARGLDPAIFSGIDKFTRFFVIGVIFGGLFVALSISAFTRMRGWLPHLSFPEYWLSVNWPSMAISNLAIAPLAVAIADYLKQPVKLSGAMTIEALLLALGVLLLTFGAATVVPSTVAVLLLLLFAPLPLLLLAALRFGSLGASVGLLLVAVPVAGFAIYRDGPLSTNGAEFNVYLTQAWLGAMGFVVHALAIQSTAQNSIRQRLSESRRRVQELAEQLLRTEETERGRLARELHDGINQQLALIGLDLGAIRDDVQPAAQTRLRGVQNALVSLADDVRRVSHNLHPAALEQAGLVPALEALAARVSEHRPGSILLDCDHDGKGLDYASSLCIYRIAQEALGNALRHADARAIIVRLTFEDGHHVLTIEDDGRGFVPHAVEPGSALGIVGMQERVRLVGGHMEIRSGAGEGTQLWIRIPKVL